MITYSKVLYFLMTLLLCITPTLAQIWTTQTSNTSETLHSIRFINNTVGWAVGNHGTILHTTNSGSTWNPQVSNSTDSLLSITFVDSMYGWVSGTKGTLLKSTNGGSNWQQIAGDTNVVIRKLHFNNRMRGFMSILHDNLDTCTIRSSIKTTLDGGETWSTIFFPPSSYHLVDFFALDSLHLWVVTNEIVYIGTNESHSTFLYRTENGGQSWSRCQTAGMMQSVVFLDSLNGVMSGYQYYPQSHGPWPPNHCMIFRTIDGGRSWEMVFDQVRAIFPKLFCFDSLRCWASQSNEIISTSNMGLTWETQFSHAVSHTVIQGAYFTDTQSGWFCGSSGMVIRVENAASLIHTSNPAVSFSSNIENFPNPFNSSTTISYSLLQSGPIDLRVSDLNGRVLCTLFRGFQQKGSYSVVFKAYDYPSGVYFCQLQTGKTAQTKKLMFLK